MATVPIGYAVMTKSAYGFGASVYGIGRAFSDDDSYDIPDEYSTLARAIASPFNCSGASAIADIADLSLDLAAGRVPVNTKLTLPLTWGRNYDRPYTLPVSTQFTKNQNRALNTLQFGSVLQTGGENLEKSGVFRVEIVGCPNCAEE